MYGSITTEADLAAYLQRQGLKPVPGSAPRTMAGAALPPAMVQAVLDSERGAQGRLTPTRTLVLPVPVSLNNCRCVVGGRIVTTAAAKRYQQHVMTTYQATYDGHAPLDGALCGTLELYPPDRRRRDLPNLEKLLGDALQAAGAYHDDSQFDEWHFYRRATTTPGYIRLTITLLRSIP